jgi:signal transduction histidine kinase
MNGAEPTSGSTEQWPELSSLCASILEHTPLSMATVEGGDHRVRYVNPAFCRLMRKNRAELIGKPFAEIIPGNDECLVLLDRVYRTGEPESHTGQSSPAPHPVFWSYMMWPVLGAGNRRVGIMLQVTESTEFHQRSAEMSEALMLGVVHQHELTEAADTLNAQLQMEITERKRAELALQGIHAKLQASADNLENTVVERTASLLVSIQELESVSYSIAHDMRAPLRAMQGFATILEQECHDKIGARGRDYLRRISDAATRMDQLIEGILNFSQMAHGELPLRPVNTDRLVRGIVEAYPDLWPVSADIEIQGTLAPVLGNETALGQCVANLLGNAVKFMAPGVKPHVRVWAEQTDRCVRLFFRDNGIGISRSGQEKIFAIFQRLSADYKVTGIGLAIVKKAMERMGGKVDVESEAGQGSTFRLELQRADLKERD